MKQYTLAVITFLLLSLNSLGQKENIEDINNKLFLNAYVHEKADSMTLSFLKDNFPYLLKKRPVDIVLPPIGIDAERSITSLKFKKHPFFDFHIKGGQLDFETIKEPGEPKFETGAELWLLFDNETDANKAFDQLIEIYKNVSTTQDINDRNGHKFAKFSAMGRDNYLRKAYFALIKIDKSNFKINFKNWFPLD